MRGRRVSDRKAAGFCGVKYHGPFGVEVSSAIKYGFLRRPHSGHVEVTDLAKKVLRPQNAGDEIEGLREAVLSAPVVGDVYKHYRGENIPDDQFFRNALIETFRLPEAKIDEFRAVFVESPSDAQLLEDVGGKRRVLDLPQGPGIGMRQAPRSVRSGRRGSALESMGMPWNRWV